MDEAIFTSLLAIIFAISTGVLYYTGHYDKYGKLAATIYKALMDSKITQEEIELIIQSYKESK